MSTDPNSPRRGWFRFSLRTLFVLLTVASVPLGWLAREISIVSERKSLRVRINSEGGIADGLIFEATVPYTVRKPYAKYRESWLREALGDFEMPAMQLPCSYSNVDRERICRAFPEAIVGMPEVTPAPQSIRPWVDLH